MLRCVTEIVEAVHDTVLLHRTTKRYAADKRRLKVYQRAADDSAAGTVTGKGMMDEASADARSVRESDEAAAAEIAQLEAGLADFAYDQSNFEPRPATGHGMPASFFRPQTPEAPAELRGFRLGRSVQ